MRARAVALTQDLSCGADLWRGGSDDPQGKRRCGSSGVLSLRDFRRAVWQPHARSVRLRRRSVKPSAAFRADSRDPRVTVHRLLLPVTEQ